MHKLSALGWVIFTIDEQRYGLPCSIVKRITRIVDITPVPNMPEGVLGLINVQGQIILVIDICQRLGLPTLAYKLQDALVIAESGMQTIGFVVNESTYVESFETSIVQDQKLVAGVECIDRIVKDKAGIIYILNLEKLTNTEDKNLLQQHAHIHKRAKR